MSSPPKPPSAIRRAIAPPSRLQGTQLYREVYACLVTILPDVLMPIITEYVGPKHLLVMYQEDKYNPQFVSVTSIQGGSPPVVEISPKLDTHTKEASGVPSTQLPCQTAICAGTIGEHTYIYYTYATASHRYKFKTSMVRYDMSKHTSVVLPSLEYDRTTKLACTLNDLLYIGKPARVSGGKVDMNCYYPIANVWSSTLKPMCSPRAHERGGMLALEGRIIACSGAYDRVTEAWDPRSPDGWQELTPMTYARADFSMVAAPHNDHSFLMIGGTNHDVDIKYNLFQSHYRGIREYDTRNNQWIAHNYDSLLYPALPLQSPSTDRRAVAGRAAVIDGTLILVPNMNFFAGPSPHGYYLDNIQHTWLKFQLPHAYNGLEYIMFATTTI